MISGFAKLFRNLRYMLATDAPARVYLRLFSTLLADRRIRAQYANELQEFSRIIGEGQFSFNWTGPYMHQWLCLFDANGFRALPVKALEIGSWEGMTSAFILNRLPEAHLTCVDTWAGAQEHQGMSQLGKIERNFDQNLSPYANRLMKFKGTSLAYFAATEPRPQFDLIYVDGSHRADDVAVDAVKAFEMLNVGGILVFDDYFWRYYKDPRDNPASAINAFLRLVNGRYEIVAVYWQLVIRKTRHAEYVPSGA